MQLWLRHLRMDDPRSKRILRPFVPQTELTQESIPTMENAVNHPIIKEYKLQGCIIQMMEVHKISATSLLCVLNYISRDAPKIEVLRRLEQVFNVKLQ